MNYTNIKPGQLVISRIRSYQEDKGPIYDIIYGIAIDDNGNRVDIYMPYSYPLYTKYVAPCTPRGKQESIRSKSLTPWTANANYVISVYIGDIIRVYKFNTTPLKVNIKTYLQQIFAPYTPRYVGRCDVKFPGDIYSMVQPVVQEDNNHYILTEKVIHVNNEINPVPPGYLYLSKDFIAYTKPNTVRKNMDPYPNNSVLIDKNNYKPLDFDNNKDGLPYDDMKWDLVLPINTLLFGIIRKNNDNNEHYFSEWFIGNQQFLMFMIILFNNTKIVTDKDGNILNDKEVIKRLTLPKQRVNKLNMDINKVKEKWQRSYMSYQHHMPEHLLPFLYLCMKYDRPEQVWASYGEQFSVDEKELFKSLFQFIQAK